MKHIVAIAALLFPLYSAAQETSSNVAFRHWAVGVGVSPEFAFRTLYNASNEPTNDTFIKLRNEREEPCLGFTGNLAMRYSINTHWGIESGVGYALRGYQTKMIDISQLTFGDMIEPRRGYIYATSDPALDFRSIRFKKAFHYIQIPIRVSYIAGKAKWRSTTSLGASYDLLFDATSTSVKRLTEGGRERDRAGSIEKFEDRCFTGMISSGVSRILTDRMELRVEPVLRYGFTRIIDAPISADLWNVGANMGFYLSL